MRRRPTLPLVGSTIGAEKLNFRVRDGNGWDLLAVITSSKKGGVSVHWRYDAWKGEDKALGAHDVREPVL